MIVGESLMGGCEGLTPIGSRYLAYFSSDQVQSDTPPMFSNLIKCLQKFFREVSIGDTFFNCDFFETSDHNIHLIELSPRPGGNFLPVVFGHVWGINVFDYYYNYLIDRTIPSLAMPSSVEQNILVTMNSQLNNKSCKILQGLLFVAQYLSSMYPNIGIFVRDDQ